MYRLAELVKSFSTLVGWKDTALDKSESGLYFQEANPLLTLRALRGVMPKDLADRYPAYEQGRIYNKGEKVSNGGKIYISLKEASETKYWLDLLHDADLLSNKEHSSIVAYCEELLKLLTSIAKTTSENIKICNVNN